MAQTILDSAPEVDVLQLGHTHTTHQQRPSLWVRPDNNAGEVVRYDLTLNADKGDHLPPLWRPYPCEGIEVDQGLA